MCIALPVAALNIVTFVGGRSLQWAGLANGPRRSLRSLFSCRPGELECGCYGSASAALRPSPPLHEASSAAQIMRRDGKRFLLLSQRCWQPSRRRSTVRSQPCTSDDGREAERFEEDAFNTQQQPVRACAREDLCALPRPFRAACDHPSRCSRVVCCVYGSRVQVTVVGATQSVGRAWLWRPNSGTRALTAVDRGPQSIRTLRCGRRGQSRSRHSHICSQRRIHADSAVGQLRLCIRSADSDCSRSRSSSQPGEHGKRQCMARPPPRFTGCLACLSHCRLQST